MDSQQLEDEFDNVPMYLAVLRGLPKLHDYRAVEYDLLTGEQLVADHDEKEDMLAELTYRLELEKDLLGQIGRTDEAYRIDQMTADIKRRFDQDPSTRGMLKVSNEAEVKSHWRQELVAQKKEGERQIEKLKHSHQQALRQKRAAIKKEKSWLDGEDWGAEMAAMRHSMQLSASTSHEKLDGLLQARLQLMSTNKKDRFQLKESQSLAQVDRAGQIAAKKEAQIVARRQVKGQFRVTDRSKDEEEIREIAAMNALDHEYEQQQLEELEKDQRREERQLGKKVQEVKTQALETHQEQVKHLQDIQKHLEAQRGIDRRIEKMNLQVETTKQQQEREDIVAYEKLQHKLHCLEHRMKRDLEKLDLKGEIFMALSSMNLDKDGNLIQAPPV